MALSKALKEKNSVTELNLSSTFLVYTRAHQKKVNSFGVTASKSIAQAMKKNTSLTLLNLSSIILSHPCSDNNKGMKLKMLGH
jgi:hypothetical protein